MKKILIAAGLILSLNVSAQKTGTKPIVFQSSKLVTINDSLQYTLGAYLGQWINNKGFSINNPDLFIKGMDDVLNNKKLMVPAQTIAIKLDAYQKQQLNDRYNKQEKLLFENLKGKTGIGMLPPGVAYEVMKAGAGVRPQPTDTVLLHVKGYLPDGKSFEDTYLKKAPLKAIPATLIKGMNEILQIMPVGSTWRVYIPSHLAYAEKGLTGVIPPYSALIFEVELISTIKK